MRTILCATLFAVAACSDDPRPADVPDALDVADSMVPDGADPDPGDVAPDVDDTASDDIDDTAPADITPDTTHDTTWPDVTYAETLLEPDPAFDPTWEPRGDLVVTTLVETLRPRFGLRRFLDDAGDLLVAPEDFGHLEPQAGEPHRLRDQLAIDPVAWIPGALPATARSLFFGLVLADPQLVDQDSPAQVAKNASRTLAGVTLPAYTPQGELGVHVNDALIRTADRFQDARPFDVVIIAGDHVENTQENELRQLHTLLNGGVVSADSGASDDPKPGPANDAFDPFVAGGFRPGTPWISSIGNHDVNIEGNFPVGLVAELTHDLELRALLDALAAPLGVAFPFEPTADHHPALFPHALRSAFRVDPDDFHPAMMTTDAELQTLTPGPTPADPERAPMGPCGFIGQTFAAAGDPPGHGFTAANDADCTGFYIHEPVADIPVRIISMDFGPHEGGSNGILAPPSRDGVLDPARAGDPRYDQVAFLSAALADAEADGALVIVISHQASDSLVEQSQLQDLAYLLEPIEALHALIDKWSPAPVDPVLPLAFRQTLAASPNVVAHIAGHNHRNRVRAICPDGSALADGEPRCEAGPNGETGYWEITTAAGIDFPHQARFVEIVHVEGRSGALYLTMLDPRIPAGSFSERARFISAVNEEMRGNFSGLGDLGDRNLLLPFEVSDALAASWEGRGRTPLTSETDLHDSHPSLPPLPVWP